MFDTTRGPAGSLIVWNDVARCELARADNGLGVRSQQTLSTNLHTYPSHRKSTTSPPGMGSANAIALLKRKRRDLLVYHGDRHGVIGTCMLAMMPGSPRSFAVCNTCEISRTIWRRRVKTSLFSSFFFRNSR